jgi:hypothetical protein
MSKDYKQKASEEERTNKLLPLVVYRVRKWNKNNNLEERWGRM